MLNLTSVLDILSFHYRLPWTEAPFRAEDIVIVTDGGCASACAMFTDVLTNIHGVRTVALGGRPIQAPMQAIGQVKGGPIMQFEHLLVSPLALLVIILICTPEHGSLNLVRVRQLNFSLVSSAGSTAPQSEHHWSWVLLLQNRSLL
ncbi:hypothetical protein VTI74DRAFT_9706 [Chaetomium olivicolor]